MEAKRPAPLVPHLEPSELAEVEVTGGHDMEEVGSFAMTGGASSASGPTVLSVVPPAVTPPMAPCAKRHIAPPFMECSTRYAMLLSFFLCRGY